MPGFVAPERPDFIPYGSPDALNLEGIGNLDALGTYYDRKFYRLSDKNFKRRHGGVLQAEKLFEDSVLNDQQGESELMPAVQNEFTRAGLVNALGAFGGTPGTLAPGSAGEASVARNLGLSVLGFQDRNRRNRQQSLLTAEAIFPRRSFGLSGADATTLSMLNAQGLNNYNQAAYSTDLQLAQAQYNQGIQQENADAAESAGQTGAAVQGGVAAAAILALALTCAVAREVYGDSDDWRAFRYWLMTDAPKWLLRAYRKYGANVAKVVKHCSMLKSMVRCAMDVAIRKVHRSWT